MRPWTELSQFLRRFLPTLVLDIAINCGIPLIKGNLHT